MTRGLPRDNGVLYLRRINATRWGNRKKKALGTESSPFFLDICCSRNRRFHVQVERTLEHRSLGDIEPLPLDTRLLKLCREHVILILTVYNAVDHWGQLRLQKFKATKKSFWLRRACVRSPSALQGAGLEAHSHNVTW